MDEIAVVVDGDAPVLLASQGEAKRCGHVLERLGGALVVRQGDDVFRERFVDDLDQVATKIAAGVDDADIIAPTHGPGSAQLAKDHLGVAGEVGVDRYRFLPGFSLNGSGVDPRGQLGSGSCRGLMTLAKLVDLPHLGLLFGALLAEKNDVGDHLGPGVLLECDVGQANGGQQVGLLCDLLADGRVIRVHQEAGDDERLHAARLERVKAGEKELVVDGVPVDGRQVRKVQPGPAEWRVADNSVELAGRKWEFLEGGVEHRLVGIKQLGYAGGDMVKLGGDEPGLAGDVSRHQAKEVAGADGRLENDAS